MATEIAFFASSPPAQKHCGIVSNKYNAITTRERERERERESERGERTSEREIHTEMHEAGAA